MSIRGTKPKLAAHALAEGDPHKVGKKKLRAQAAIQSVAETGFGPCPASLTGIARRKWDELSSQLEIMGLNKRPDSTALEGCCIAYAHAAAADRLIETHGLMIETYSTDEESGEKTLLEVKANPAYRMSVQFWGQYHRFCSEFGLTPVSRQRIAATSKDEGAAMKELQAILNRPRTPRMERSMTDHSPAGDPDNKETIQ